MGKAEYVIEKEWESSGFKCVVLNLIERTPPHRCGYVGISQNHPLHGCEYNTHSFALIKAWEAAKNGPVGKRGIISLFCASTIDAERATPELVFDVHGGITYSGSNENGYPPATPDDLWWYGYDCAHCDDTPEKCTLEYCVNECENLAKQLAEIKPKKK